MKRYHIEKGILDSVIYCGEVEGGHWVNKKNVTGLACLAVAKYIDDEVEGKTLTVSVNGKPKWSIEVKAVKT